MSLRYIVACLFLWSLPGSIPGCSASPSRDGGVDTAGDAAKDDDEADDEADANEVEVEHWTARAANNRDYLPLALEMINGAERRVHVVEYVIYPGGPVQDIIDALIAAAERGVEVMVLADESSDATPGALETLRAGGVEAQLDAPTVITHNKLIIVDDQVLVGSANLTNNALDSNNEANIYVSDANVAAFYEAYFQALWRDPAAEPRLVWGRDTRLVPLTDRDIFDTYLGCIEGAEQEIMVVLYAMRYDDAFPNSSYSRLVTALVEAHHRGRQVQVVLDGSDWITSNHINDVAMELILAEGIAVRVPPASRITHAKLLICDDTVVVSDANWSRSALERYHGTSVQVTDVTIADEYRDYFHMIWEQSPAP